MRFKNIAVAILAFLISGVFGCLWGQVPISLRLENNAKTVVDATVQITSPAGERKVWTMKDLEKKTIEYSVAGKGECTLFVRFKEKGVKAPTFITKKFKVSGEEKQIAVYSSIDLADMTVLCGGEYSNRRQCSLKILKRYPALPDGGYPEGYENAEEKTNFWNYSITSVISDK